MRTLAHISDLHFGREEPMIAEALRKELHEQRPHLVVVSGDLTQRAREREFVAARAWLETLPAPRLVVPGNHDVPLFDVLRRFTRPLETYRRHMGEDLSPFHRDEEMAVLGINTARSWTFKGGRISREQIAALRERLRALPPALLKIVVSHHQFVPRRDRPSDELAGRADLALAALQECRVDMLLAGHLHAGFAGDTRAYRPLARSIVVVQCGTSISQRLRDEVNSYNLITLESARIVVSMRCWSGSGFTTVGRSAFVRGDDGWTAAATAPPTATATAGSE